MVALVTAAMAMFFSSCTKTTCDAYSNTEVYEVLQESGIKELQAITLQEIDSLRNQKPVNTRTLGDSVALYDFSVLRVDDTLYCPDVTFILNTVALFGVTTNYTPYDTNSDDIVDTQDILSFIGVYGNSYTPITDFYCWEEVMYFNEGQSEMTNTCTGEFGFLKRTPVDEPGYNPTMLPEATTLDLNSVTLTIAGGSDITLVR